MTLDHIKTLRKKLCLTQGELAKKANVSQSLIAKIEAKKIDPTYSKTQQILKALQTLDHQQSLQAHQFMQKRVLTAQKDASLKETIALMKKHNISQLPVFDKQTPIGLLSESSILHALVTATNRSLLTIANVMTPPPPVIAHNTTQQVITQLLEHFPLVLVSNQGKITGLITKTDILTKVL